MRIYHREFFFSILNELGVGTRKRLLCHFSSVFFCIGEKFRHIFLRAKHEKDCPNINRELVALIAIEFVLKLKLFADKIS